MNLENFKKKKALVKELFSDNEIRKLVYICPSSEETKSDA
jgi:hypothetical protein